MIEVECWDHCKKCQRSQNRFWVTSAAQFEKERAETLKHKCGFCGAALVSYHSKNDTFKVKGAES